MKYKKLKNPLTLEELAGLLKYDDEGNFLLSIPKDPANTDYQEYLKWLALGNVPEPADV